MIFELEPIFQSIGARLPFSYEMDLSDVSLNETHPFIRPVAVDGSFENRAGVVYLYAEVSFLLSMQCDRCAAQTEMPFQYRVEHILVQQLNDENNDELICLESSQMDLDALLGEDIFLLLPSKFLCRVDCKGLCPQCGQNLNDGPCSCTKTVDPRLESLLQLLENT